MLSGSYIRVCRNATFEVCENVKIRNSRIIITPGSSMQIGSSVNITNTNISLVDGNLSVGDFSIIGTPIQNVLVNIEKGSIAIGHHTKMTAKRIWIRFNGRLNIGNYTNINYGSEIRCDESINIGSYNQISYDVNIWDTNTHNIYPAEQRKDIAEKYYPYFGKEIERPKTKPITIGDFCWIGERSSILKGTTLGNEVSVGYNTLIAGKTIESGHVVVEKRELKVI